MVTANAFSTSRSISLFRYASSSSGAALPRRRRCSTSRSDMPKRDAMAATDWPASVSFANATTWSAGCIAMRTNFFRERDFAGLDVAGFDQAGHGMVGVEHFVLDQCLHGLEAAAAGDHGIALGVDLSRTRSKILAGSVDPVDEAFQQSEGGDRGLELGIGLGVGRRLADVLGGEGEPAQQDLPDERFCPSLNYHLQ